MRVMFKIIFLTILVSCLFSAIVHADETGLVSMHELRRYGRYLCTTSHEHTGLGDMQKTRKLAIRAAARRWSAFTAWEYGDAWATWRHARGKKVTCEGQKGAISCVVLARPCRRLRKASR